MGVADDLQQLDLVVATVAGVSEHPGARAPSWLLDLDLGGRGRREGSIPRGDSDARDLEGTQVACALRGDEVIVLAARSHAGGIVLLRPEHEVEPGTVVA